MPSWKTALDEHLQRLTQVNLAERGVYQVRFGIIPLLEKGIEDEDLEALKVSGVLKCLTSNAVRMIDALARKVPELEDLRGISVDDLGKDPARDTRQHVKLKKVAQTPSVRLTAAGQAVAATQVLLEMSYPLQRNDLPTRDKADRGLAAGLALWAVVAYAHSRFVSATIHHQAIDSLRRCLALQVSSPA